MPLIRPEAARAFFERSPLSLVVCQVQFAPILGIDNPAFIAAFQEELRAEYPSLGRVGGLDIVVGPAGVEAKQGEAGGWLFASADGAWAIVLAQNALSIRTSRYTQYEELRDRFLWALDRCIAHFKPGARTRLGLRYVNRLVFDDVTTVTAWRELVRPELLGIVSSPELADDSVITHSLGQTRFAEEESQLLARYGYVQGGIEIVLGDEKPDLAERIHFLLDFDHFDIRGFPTLDPHAIAGQLNYFHEQIHRLFHWCLSTEATRRLGVGHEVPASETSSFQLESS
jgi:uncharacterized protein (TIGR04255 family)